MKFQKNPTFLRSFALLCSFLCFSLFASCGGGQNDAGGDSNASDGNASAQWWQQKQDDRGDKKKLRNRLCHQPDCRLLEHSQSGLSRCIQGLGY